MVISESSPFGSPSRTRVLKSLQLLGQSFPRELARVTRTSLAGIQKALLSLERDGLVVGRTMGRMRVFTLNPRYFASRELEALIDRLAEADTELIASVAALRRRPRRSGKPLA